MSSSEKKNGVEDWEKKLEEINKVIESSDRSNWVDFYNRGLIYYELKKYHQAIADYSKSIELSPESASPYYKRGVCMNRINENERAIENYTRAVEIDPLYFNAFYNLGNTYDDEGDISSAIENYTKAIEIDPSSKGSVDAYINRGIMYSNLGENEKSISDYITSIGIDPENESAFLNLGSVYDDIGEYDKAIEYFNKTIQISPKCADAFFNRAVSYFNSSRNKDCFDPPTNLSNKECFIQSTKDYTTAIRLGSNKLDCLEYRGDSYKHLEEYGEAIEDYAAMIKLLETTEKGTDKSGKRMKKAKKMLFLCKKEFKKKKKEMEEVQRKKDIFERFLFMRENLKEIFFLEGDREVDDFWLFQKIRFGQTITTLPKSVLYSV